VGETTKSGYERNEWTDMFIRQRINVIFYWKLWEQRTLHNKQGTLQYEHP